MKHLKIHYLLVAILILIWMLIETIYFYFWNIIRFVWCFKWWNWSDWFSEKEFYRTFTGCPYIDKNPKQTFIRLWNYIF